MAAINTTNMRAGTKALHDCHLAPSSGSVFACIPGRGNLFLYGFLLTLFAISLSLPASALDSKQTVKGYYHTSWTTKDGLPGAVLSLAQTTDGFLWIAGTGGLFRFDGFGMERYTPLNGPFLHESALSALLATRDGGLWIGYPGGGASFLKNGNITNYTERDGLPARQLRCFAQDGDGAVWAALVGGLARFDGKHWQKIQTDWNYPGKTAWSVTVDHVGTVWATSEDRIFFLPRGERRFQDAGLAAASGVLLVAPDNGLWLTEPLKNSIDHLQMQAGKLKRSATQIQATSWTPMFDRDGGLWIGGWGDGILHIPSPGQLPEGTFSKLSPGPETFTEAEGLSDNHATIWLEDREGNIWIGTNFGLDRLRRSSLSWFALHPGTHSFSLIPSTTGEIAAASAFGEMVTVPQGTPVRNAPRDVLISYRDPSGVVWLNSDDGSSNAFHGSLFQWKEHRFIKVALPPALESIQVSAMTADFDGNLWISIISKGMYRFRNGVWTHIDVIKDIPTATPSAAITDSKGRVWLAFPKRKRVIVMTDGVAQSLSTEKDISIGPVNLLARSGEPIWAAGSLGIAVFLNDAFHTVKADDGSTFADVNRVVATTQDGVWLSAPQGIVHIPQDEVEHVVREPSYRVKYELFDQVSDLPDSLQTDGDAYVSAVQGSDGLLWFATRNGVARIDPRKIPRNLLAPPVSIRSISADGKEYASDTGSSLPALTKDLRIEYAALSLSINEKVRYRYRLDGWDTDWVNAGRRRQAFYTNLAPGKYRFHVIACNNDGVWNNEGATLEFRIAPAWFQMPWFLVLCGVVGVSIVWVLYRLRLRQMATALSARFDERLAERTRIARDLHDTFLQTIQGSKLVADSALKQSGDPLRMRGALEQLSVWLGRATEEGRAALNSLRTSTTETNDLAEAFRRAIEECQIENSMEARFSVDGEMKEMHPIVRDEVYRIGYEAIRNACVHSKANQLQVTLTYAEELELRVADNGIGIDPLVAAHGKDGHFGLQGMRERATRIAGKLHVNSSPESGTEIKLVVPGKIIYRKDNV